MEIGRIFSIQRKAAVYAFAFLALCPLLAAQKLPSIEVFGGYSYLRFETTKFGFSDKSDLNGWNGGISLPDLYQGFGVAADVSGHYTRELAEYNVLIGPQYSFTWKGARLYGHGLFGKARTRLREPGSTQLEPSDLHRAIALGGGLDFPVSPRFSVRVVQADYLITSAFGSTQKNVRLSTGLIFRFGKR